MTNGLAKFTVGSLYSSAQIQECLEVGNAGGVRLCLNGAEVRRMVVLTSLPDARVIAENPYHDRTEGDVLVYTGAGREGDQSLAGINKRIPQQCEALFPIYCFQSIGSRRNRSLGPNRWQFVGLLQYLRHYPETQFDVRSERRQVWLFEFFIHKEPTIVRVRDERTIFHKVVSSFGNKIRQLADDREVIESITSGPSNVGVEAERARLLSLTPRDFEKVVRDALVASGFDRVEVTRYSQDGGIDVNAYAGSAMWPIRNLLLQVQAKRWLHTVGRKEVAELRGSLQPFARGAVVTTSHFSKAAISEASEAGKNPIVLVDGYAFAMTTRAIRQCSTGDIS